MSKPANFDLAIVGGGPAGCAAAIGAAANGLRAVLLEKSAAPRPPVCGGWVGPAALKFLP